MIAPNASRSPYSASTAMRAGRPIFGPPHSAERNEPATIGVAMTLSAISVKIPSPTALSPATIAPRMVFRSPVLDYLDRPFQLQSP